MQVALFFALAVLFPLFLQNNPTPEQIRQARSAAEKHRETAIRLNEVLGNIRTEADAQGVVNNLADMFADQLPPPWATVDVRHRVADAEYKSATDAHSRIPEERIAMVWNEYIREIGAADEAMVTAEDVHNLRDLKYASAKTMWSRGLNQSIWTMPNTYAVSGDGKVALDGCRALEAIAILYDLDNFFENLRTARKLAGEGIIASDKIQQAEERRRLLDQQGLRPKVTARLEAHVSDNPVQIAERRYVSENGVARMYVLLSRLADELFPQQP